MEWIKVKCNQSKNEIPVGRYHHTCCKINKLIYIFGGKSKKEKLNDLWTLDIENYKFTNLSNKVSGTAPTPRYGHVAAAIGQYMIVFGGFSLDIEVSLNGYTNDIHLFDTGIFFILILSIFRITRMENNPNGKYIFNQR